MNLFRFGEIEIKIMVSIFVWGKSCNIEIIFSYMLMFLLINCDLDCV